MPKIIERAGVNAAAVAVVRNGNVTFSRSFGTEMDGDAAGPETLFGMESVTKTITAMVILSLAEKGLLNLDEPLHRYWVDPDLIANPKHRLITFRMAMRHLTTLPNWREKEGLKFAGEPGSVQSYSGEGYEYARRALIKKFGKSLEELAKEHVYLPARTKSMSFLWPVNGDQRAAGFHFGDYAFDFDKNMSEASAASDLVATASDLGLYAAWLAKGAGISSDSWARILTPNSSSLRKDGDDSLIGEGFFVFDQSTKGNLPIFGHGGSAMGARTMIVIDPGNQNAIAIATSSGSGLAVIRALIETAFKKGRSMPELERELHHWESFDY